MRGRPRRAQGRLTGGMTDEHEGEDYIGRKEVYVLMYHAVTYKNLIDRKSVV